jgi:hypothetical protein
LPFGGPSSGVEDGGRLVVDGGVVVDGVVVDDRVGVDDGVVVDVSPPLPWESWMRP